MGCAWTLLTWVEILIYDPSVMSRALPLRSGRGVGWLELFGYT